MKRSIRNIVSCYAWLLACSFTIQATSDIRTSSTQYDLPNFKPLFALSKRIVEFANNFRAKKGKKPLTWDRRLTNLSRGHSVNMGLNGVPFGHAGFDNRVRNFPSPALAAAENIFMGSITGDIAKTIVDSWINSSEHRKNLLGNFNIAGVGLYKNSLGIWFVTQLLGLIN